MLNTEITELLDKLALNTVRFKNTTSKLTFLLWMATFLISFFEISNDLDLILIYVWYLNSSECNFHKTNTTSENNRLFILLGRRWTLLIAPQTLHQIIKKAIPIFLSFQQWALSYWQIIQTQEKNSGLTVELPGWQKDLNYKKWHELTSQKIFR